jgi:hypothetical protein
MTPLKSNHTPDVRSTLIGAVQGPYGFLTLTVLVIEGILVAIVPSADPPTVTTLVYGMIGTLVFLILTFAVLVVLRPLHLLPPSPPYLLPPSPPSPPPPVKDFRTGFFKADFYEYLRDPAKRRAEMADNLKAEKVVAIHFIREDFQIGFRAYKGLSPIRRGRDGLLPLRVYTNFRGIESTVNYFDWIDNKQHPTIGSRTAVSPTSTPVLSVNSPCHLSVFKFYNDSPRPDAFHVNPFSVDTDSDVSLHHYVVVRNEDLSRWHPNKFVFEVRSDGTIDFSPAVYVPARSLSTDAQEIISKFLMAVPSPNLQPAAMKHFQSVKRHIGEIFHETSFKSDVTVFWLGRNASETNLFLGYAFSPPNFGGDVMTAVGSA